MLWNADLDAAEIPTCYRTIRSTEDFMTFLFKMLPHNVLDTILK